MNDEWHLASFIIQVRTEAIASVVAAIETTTETELAAGDGGTLVVIVEAPTRAAVTAAADRLRELPGVLAVNLVHQQAKPRAARLGEIAHADAAT